MLEPKKDSLISQNQQIEMQEEKRQELELAYLSTLKPLKGHVLFEINRSTLEVSEAEYQKNELIMWEDALILSENPSARITKDVIVKAGYSYVSALNAKSALKRYREGKGSASLPTTNESIKLN